MLEISFCCALKTTTDSPDRTANFLRAVGAYEALGCGDHELVVADYGSTLDWQELRERAPFPIVVESVSGYFNRAQGLNRAAARARSPLLFFVDADILVPARFCETLRRCVGAGRAFFPRCFRLKQGSPLIVRPGLGRWAPGFGMCGILAQDFARVGGWDEVLGRSWGGEDREFFGRARRRLAVDTSLSELLDQWHPRSIAYREKFSDPRVENASPWKRIRNRKARREGLRD